MADFENLIDFSCDNESQQNKTVSAESTAEHFKDPYDPFDVVEKEACLKALETHVVTSSNNAAAQDSPVVFLEYPDLSSESPPVGMASQDNSKHKSKSFSKLMQKQFLKLSVPPEILNTPSKSASINFGKPVFAELSQMLAAESPLKLIEDDQDSSFSSRQQFENDLKMLTLPMLEIPKTASKEKSTTKKESSCNASSIKKTDEHDVAKLLQDLKDLVRDNLEPYKQAQFDAILKSLSAAKFAKSACEDATTETGKTISPTYTRQGTFDIELQERNNEKQKPLIEDLNVIATPPLAVFNKETQEVGPCIETPLTSHEIMQQNENCMRQVIGQNLVKHINELLDQQNLGQAMVNEQDQHSSEHNKTKTSTFSQNNRPTVILVVNPSTAASQQPPSYILCPSPSHKQVTNTIEQASLTRRRSSSLSIHDKAQITRGSGSVKPNVEDNHKELPSVNCDKRAVLRQRRNSCSIVSTASNKISARAEIGSRLKTYGSGLAESNIKGSASVKAASIKLLKTETCGSNYSNHDLTIQETIKAGKLFYTSTPMSQMRSQQRTATKTIGNTGYLKASTTTPLNIRRPSFSKNIEHSAITKPRASCLPLSDSKATAESSQKMAQAVSSKAPLKNSQESNIRKASGKFKM